MKKTIRPKERFMVFRAYRKPDAPTYHQYRINGKIVTFGRYMKTRMMCLYDLRHHLYKSYTELHKNGSIVDVDIL